MPDADSKIRNPELEIREPVFGCIEVCQRCQQIAAYYASTTDRLAAYQSIGPHLRHCINHFQSILSGMIDGHIHYDARDRDPRIEQEPEYASRYLDRIISDLSQISDYDFSKPVKVVQLASSRGNASVVDSSLARELIFASSHTIHHVALIVEIAARQDFALPNELGVAFSTAQHQNQVGE